LINLKETKFSYFCIEEKKKFFTNHNNLICFFTLYNLIDILLSKRSSFIESGDKSLPEVLIKEFESKDSISKSSKNEKKQIIQLDYNNILLPGSSLKNTDYIYGIIVYAGHHNKIMMNSLNARTKISRDFKLMNKHLTVIIFVQILLSLSFSILHFLFQKFNLKNKFITNINENNDDLYYVIIFFSWILTLSNIVPISLLVTIEMIKFCQAFFISWDHKIYDLNNKRSATVQSSGLNEELGQVKVLIILKIFILL